jgi:hypothetical protein
MNSKTLLRKQKRSDVIFPDRANSLTVALRLVLLPFRNEQFEAPSQSHANVCYFDDLQV